jgi:UPF0755 protein
LAKFIGRLIVFIIAIAAMAAIFGVGIWYFSRQGGASSTQITLNQGENVIQRQPQNIEETALGMYLQFRSQEINAPASDSAEPVDFTIAMGESALTVAEKLKELGMVADPDLFRLFLRYNQMDNSLEAGNYTLQRNMSIREIAAALQKAKIEEVSIVIKEGWRAEEVADELEKNGIIDHADFLAAVKDSSIVSSPILADRPAGASYEGYLYPDTYRLPKKAKPDDLIKRMIDNLAAKLPADAVSQASAQGLTLYEVITVASIVEREAVIASERPLIASVYLNRIKQGMYLNADPTVQYAIGFVPDAKQWWKTPVTLEEYQQVISPYNTYLNPGLPPGPICSPRIDSILGVLSPTPSDYLYFVATGDGSHIFARTLEEHEANVRAYQGQ